MPLVLFNHHMQDGRLTESNGTVQTISARDGESGSLPLVLMDQGGNRTDILKDQTGTLRALGHTPLVLFNHHKQDGRLTDSGGVAQTIMACTGKDSPPLVLAVYENQRSEVRLSEKSNAITQPGGKPGQGNPVVLQEVYRISSDASNCMRSGNPRSGFNKADISPTIDTIDPSPSKAQGGGKGYLGQDDKSFTLATNNDQYLMTKDSIPVNTQARVRKLTPVECERLQGFPDNWTRIPYRNKTAEDCPDSPRYKAIGNSWAVPCVRWIGERIQVAISKEAK